MVGESDLNTAKIKVRSENSLLEVLKKEEKSYRTAFLFGLAGGAYIGIRAFIGPEIDLDNINSLYGVADGVAGVIAGFCGVLGGLGYAVTHFNRKGHEKSLNEAKSNLGLLSEKYLS
jgi:hypothetical protein